MATSQQNNSEHMTLIIILSWKLAIITFSVIKKSQQFVINPVLKIGLMSIKTCKYLFLC